MLDGFSTDKESHHPIFTHPLRISQIVRCVHVTIFKYKVKYYTFTSHIWERSLCTCDCSYYLGHFVGLLLPVHFNHFFSRHAVSFEELRLFKSMFIKVISQQIVVE